MSVTVETVETNRVKLTITISTEVFNKALDVTFKKVVKNVSVPGFRKGKVPRKLFEQTYGVESLYEKALDSILPQEYMKAVDEAKISPVASPTWDIEQIGKDQELIVTAVVAVKPEVELGQYTGVEVEELSTEVTDDDVQEEINKLLENHAEMIVKETAIESGDTVIIDFEGFKNGEAFEGGKGENHTLEIGSNSFIPGFEEQLIGLNAGEEKEITVTFPEDYHAEDLAGQEAVFKVKIHEVKARQLPELDDEFIKDLDREGIETVAELKADLEKTVKERKETTAKNHLIDTVVNQVTENAKFEIPAEMIDSKVEQMIEEQERRFQGQGLNLDLYFQYTGTDLDGLKDQLRPEAEKQVSQTLTLEAIMNKENIEVTEAEVEQSLVEMAESYGYEVEQLKQMLPNLSALEEDLKMRKTVDFIVEQSVRK